MRTFCILSTIAISASIGAKRAEEYTPLFDGKTLEGWTFIVKPDKEGKRADPANTWSARDGIIHCSGKPNGCMVTKKEYADYSLKVKWRWPADGKGGNSGVLVHVQDDKYWPTSIEAQLLTERAGDLLLTNPPEVKLEVDKSRQDPKIERCFRRTEAKEPVEKKLGEWNEMEVRCRGGDIVLIVNGIEVNEGKNGNLRSGRIALQSEGAPVDFKDIVIAGLK